MRITPLKTLVGSLLLSALVYSATAQADLLRVTGSLWPPYVDGELENGGLAADLVRTALERAGYEVEGSVEPWGRAYEGAAIGV